MSKRLAFLSLVVGLAGLWPAVAAGQPLPIKLDPRRPPAPTMKTLDEIPPTWSRALASERFELVLGDEAVLDKETGLVWERTPGSVRFNWADAHESCIGRRTGRRMGWRLPSMAELTSVLDPFTTPPSLAAGHPFSLAPEFDLGQWSSTSSSNSALTGTIAWAIIHLADCTGCGYLFVTIPSDRPKIERHIAWCVRGPSGAGGQ